jgi:hypothetical protein
MRSALLVTLGSDGRIKLLGGKLGRSRLRMSTILLPAYRLKGVRPALTAALFPMRRRSMRDLGAVVRYVFLTR